MTQSEKEEILNIKVPMPAKSDREKRLEEALKFYADRNNWQMPEIINGEIKEVIHSSDLGCKAFNGENNFADYAIPSGGRRAREALDQK